MHNLVASTARMAGQDPRAMVAAQRGGPQRVQLYAAKTNAAQLAMTGSSNGWTSELTRTPAAQSISPMTRSTLAASRSAHQAGRQSPTARALVVAMLGRGTVATAVHRLNVSSRKAFHGRA